MLCFVVCFYPLVISYKFILVTILWLDLLVELWTSILRCYLLWFYPLFISSGSILRTYSHQPLIFPSCHVIYFIPPIIYYGSLILLGPQVQSLVLFLVLSLVLSLVLFSNLRLWFYRHTLYSASIATVLFCVSILCIYIYALWWG
jgi:hypothetical protein